MAMMRVRSTGMPADSATAMSWPTARMSWPSLVFLNQTMKTQRAAMTRKVAIGIDEGPELEHAAGCPGTGARPPGSGCCGCRSRATAGWRGSGSGMIDAHHVEHHELVDAVDEEGEDVARDHLAALGLVEDRAADLAHEDRRSACRAGRRRRGPRRRVMFQLMAKMRPICPDMAPRVMPKLRPMPA